MKESLQQCWLNGELVCHRENGMKLTCAFHLCESVIVLIAHQTQQFSGHELNETKMNLMEKNSVECATDLSFPKIQTSELTKIESISLDYSQSQHIDPFDLNVQHAFLATIDFVAVGQCLYGGSGPSYLNRYGNRICRQGIPHYQATGLGSFSYVFN